MESTTNNSNLEQSFAQKVIEKIRRIFDKYMSHYKDYDNLKEFMSNDENLYNPDGSLTEEYKRRIKEVEDFVTINSIDKTLQEEIVETSNDSEVLSGIIEFVERRKEVIKEFAIQQQIYGEDFNSEKFIQTLVAKNSSNENEKQELLEFIENMAERDALEALSDDEVREGFSRVINHK